MTLDRVNLKVDDVPVLDGRDWGDVCPVKVHAFDCSPRKAVNMSGQSCRARKGGGGEGKNGPWWKSCLGSDHLYWPNCHA